MFRSEEVFTTMSMNIEYIISELYFPILRRVTIEYYEQGTFYENKTDALFFI